MPTYPNAIDLIRIADVKAWLATGKDPFPPTSDDLLSRIVSSVSQFAASYLQRNLQPASYTETRNGGDTASIMLRNRPILSVSSLTIGSTSFQPRTTVGGTGFVFDDSMLYLGGYQSFCRGAQNVVIAYRAGFQASDTVTLANPIVPFSTWDLTRHWNSDQGVAYVGGLPLTRVTVAPTVAGTYQLSADSGRSAEYVFATADAGASVVVTYGYTPEDVVQGLTELAAERYTNRTHIGQSTQSLGGQQTAGFSQRDMGATVKMLLDNYRNVVPIP